MAKIKTSALVADIKGKVGGNVFASNKGGNYVRRNKKPTNKNSINQQAVRTNFGKMAGVWRQLAQSQRNGWNEGAVNFPYQDALGETKILSGQQLFNKLNNNLVQAGLPLMGFCPVPQSFPALSFDSVSNSVTPNAISVEPAWNGVTVPTADFFIIIKATAKMSKGIDSPQAARFKKLFVADDTVLDDPLELGSTYVPLFGDLILNDTIFLSMSLISTISGEVSIPITYQSTRTAT